jgi:ABC-type uncharacterized transport system permease subunit
VIVELWHLSAALYLAAALWLAVGALLPHGHPRPIALLLLAAGALSQGVGFARLHTLDPTPPLTDFPSAVSLMAWIAVLFAAAMLHRRRLELLAAPIAGAAFVALLYGTASLGASAHAVTEGAGGWPHLHVILASAGLVALGIAACAGSIFLLEDRALKQKRPLPVPRELRAHFPSLEALDRVNWAALVLGFPLLTVGVIAGMLWSQALVGRPWGGAHATWTGLAWLVYVALVVARFGAGWRGRRAALSATAGFALLAIAVIGAEVMA